MWTVIFAALSGSAFAQIPGPRMVQFSAFQSDFARKYTSQEKSQRFQVFSASLDRVLRRNEESQANEGGAVFGVTRFSDMTPEEFRAKYLTFIPPPPLAQSSTNPRASTKSAPLGSMLPALDWRNFLGRNYVTPVKDQLYCGSCWAFSAIQAVESYQMIAGVFTQPLSTQQITSCDTGSGGCNGGNPITAYNYIIQNGVTSEAAYPYEAANSVCKVAPGDTSVSGAARRLLALTRSPTLKPTTRAPTAKPTTRAPTTKPTTRAPTLKPTGAKPTTNAPTTIKSTTPPSTKYLLTETPSSLPPSARPTTQGPTARPTTQSPTARPTTQGPTARPTTKTPTARPTTQTPTARPTTRKPTTRTPTAVPTTRRPTPRPTTRSPTPRPTTQSPSSRPTGKTARNSSNRPTTRSPVFRPTTKSPTYAPTTRSPTLVPTTRSPTLVPTTRSPTPPTERPTRTPTHSPTTKTPTTTAPTLSPITKAPTLAPTTKTPTLAPTTKTPTLAPTTKIPTTSAPTSSPSLSPTTLTPTQAPTFQVSARLTSWASVESGEDNLKFALQPPPYNPNGGPISVCLAADPLQDYVGGILRVCDGVPNHCLQAVGYGNEEGVDYWILRNQWGEGWGENGYVRVEMGKNLCSLATTLMTYPIGVDA